MKAPTSKNVPQPHRKNHVSYSTNTIYLSRSISGAYKWLVIQSFTENLRASPASLVPIIRQTGDVAGNGILVG